MKSEVELQNAIETYGDMIRKVCYVHTKQECDVDDIFQIVFLKYFESASFQNKEHEKAWLLRVCINACKDYSRSWFKKNVVLSEYLSHHVDSNGDISIAILDAVLHLPAKYKNVIYLYYYEGYKVKEISTILQKKENTIHTWLKRSKEELRELLGGDYFA